MPEARLAGTPPMAAAGVATAELTCVGPVGDTRANGPAAARAEPALTLALAAGRAAKEGVAAAEEEAGCAGPRLAVGGPLPTAVCAGAGVCEHSPSCSAYIDAAAAVFPAAAAAATGIDVDAVDVAE